MSAFEALQRCFDRLGKGVIGFLLVGGQGSTTDCSAIGKGKGKALPRTGHEGPAGEHMYSSTLPSTSALEGGGWSTPRPASLPTVKTRYPLYRRLGGPQGCLDECGKSFPPPGFDPRTVQPVMSRYTD